MRNVEVTSKSPTRGEDADRRQFNRRMLAVELELVAPSYRLRFFTRTYDVAPDSIFVRSNHRLPIGATVEVLFPRGPLFNPLRVTAQVVRSGFADQGRSKGMALRFLPKHGIEMSLLAARFLDPNGGASVS